MLRFQQQVPAENVILTFLFAKLNTVYIYEAPTEP